MLALLLACQQPFGTNRHDLEGFRIAALAAEPAGGPSGTSVQPSAAIVVDGQLWSDEPVDLAWYWTDATDAAVRAAAGEPAATGPSPTLSLGGRLLLVATLDGEERRAFLDLPETADPAPALNGVDVLDLDVPYDAWTAADLALEPRAAREGTPTDAIPSGGTARLAARIGTDQPFLRWMSTAGGTFFELDAVTADWTAGSVTVDDEDVLAGDPVPDGRYALLALALGTRGNNAFAVRDFFVGDAAPGVFANDRFLPASTSFSATLVRGTLIADDGPSGLALADAVAVTAEDLDPDDPYGTASLCGSWNRPFDPSWLASQRCARSDVLGRTVVVDAR